MPWKICEFIKLFTDCRKLYQCDECDQICMATSFLKKHKRIHAKQPKEEPHKCAVCDANFTDKAYLKRHAVKHTGVKEFECDVCHKMFSHQRECSPSKHKNLYSLTCFLFHIGGFLFFHQDKVFLV